MASPSTGVDLQPTGPQILALFALPPLVVAPITLLLANPADAGFFALWAACLLALAIEVPEEL